MHILQQNLKRPLECVWKLSGNELKCQWIELQKTVKPGELESNPEPRRRIA